MSRLGQSTEMLYPRPAATWPARTHEAAHVPHSVSSVVLLGRLTEWNGRRGRLVDASGEQPFLWTGSGRPQARTGDLVALSGSVEGGTLRGEQLDVLVRSRPPLAGEGGDWIRFSQGRRLRDNLVMRARIMEVIRQFFSARGFLEVETPIFVTGTGQEGHLDFFESEWHQDGHDVRGVLIPSPEHHMKRLLGGGFERIFQIARCFRNGERTPHHNPEFSMLEWYRAYATYDDVMEDVEQLFGYVLRQLGRGTKICYQGRTVDMSPPWPRITVQDAFLRFAGVDLEGCGDADTLRQAAQAQGCESISSQDSWEDGFHKLLVERVEPGLAELGAVFLTDYPLPLGALARRSIRKPALAERAEAYVGGLELANGFSELNDPVEQEERFQLEAERRRRAGLGEVPTDQEFLGMLAFGMPPAGGMALGIDRLAMLCAGSRHIDEVIAFPLTLPRNS